MEASSPKSIAIYSPTLSKREVGLFSEWERERRTSVTLAEISARVGSSATKDVVKSLIRKKVLERLDKGIYLVRPFRLLLRRTSSTPPVLAAVLLQREPYYLGGLWAFSHHGLSQQRFGSVLDAFVSRPRPSRQFGAAKLILHVVDPDRMNWGIDKTIIEAVEVNVSDLERTLLDILDYPRLAGGVRHSLMFFKEGLRRANRKRLVDYAVRGGRLSTCQRLGVLLERSGSSARSLLRLQKKAAETKSVLSMIAGDERRGPLNKRWNVVENDQ